MDQQHHVALLELLRTCVEAALIAQRYVHCELLGTAELIVKEEEEEGKKSNKPSSSSVGSHQYLKPLVTFSDSEGNATIATRLSEFVNNLVTKKKGMIVGEQSGQMVLFADVVTEADCVVQEIIQAFLRKKYGSGLFIMGEEEKSAHPRVSVKDVDTLRDTYSFQGENETYFSAFGNSLSQEAAATSSSTTMDSVDISRIGIFIDPIDGTKSFVAGNPEIPMILVGICVDGIPVGGVMNRIFQLEELFVSVHENDCGDKEDKKTEEAMPPAKDTKSEEEHKTGGKASSWPFPCRYSLSFCMENGPCMLWGVPISRRYCDEVQRQEDDVLLNNNISHNTRKSETKDDHDANEKIYLRAAVSSTRPTSTLNTFSEYEPFIYFATSGAGHKTSLLAQHLVRNTVSRLPNLAKLAENSLKEHRDKNAQQNSDSTTWVPNIGAVDCYFVDGGICWWDIASGHAFLRWIGGDLLLTRGGEGEGGEWKSLKYPNEREARRKCYIDSALIAVRSAKVKEIVESRVKK